MTAEDAGSNCGDAPESVRGWFGDSLPKVWKRIGREAVLVLFGQALSSLAGLLSVRILTVFFSREAYGVAWLFINGVTLASLATAGAVAKAAGRFYHDDGSEHHMDRLLGIVWRLQIIITIVAASIYLMVISVGGYSAGKEGFAAWIMPVYFFFSSFLTISQILLNSSRKRLQNVFLGVLEAWLKPCGAILLCIVWKPDANAFVGGYAATSVLTGLMGIYYLNQFGSKSPPMPWQPDRKLMRQVISYSAPLAVMTVLTWVLALSDRYIINWQLGAALTGTYVAAYQVGSAVFQLLGGAFGPLVQPIVFQRGSRSMQAGGETISSCYRVFAWLSLPATALFLVLHEWMMRWLVHKAYWNGMTAVIWIGLGTYMWIFGNVGADAFLLSKRNGPLVVITAVSAIANIALNFYLIPRMGIEGAGIATFVAYTLYALGIVWQGRKIILWRFPWESFLAIGMVSGVAGIFSKMVHIVLFKGMCTVSSFIGVVFSFTVVALSGIYLSRSQLRHDYKMVSA